MPNGTKVEDIKPGGTDFAGNLILKIYAYNPPDYAVYRTCERVVVEFADDKQAARDQRTRIAPLTLLRGQVNALIDGWHTSGTRRAVADSGEQAAVGDDVGKPWQLPWSAGRHQRNRARAAHYDRRVADAIVTALEEDPANGNAILSDIKDDIIAERRTIARGEYFGWALLLTIATTLVLALLAHHRLDILYRFDPPRLPVWIGMFGGTVGAFFSVAIGLKGKDLAIDLQGRENTIDAVLRILVGTLSGGVLICLLFSKLVSIAGIHVVPGGAGGGGGVGGSGAEMLVFVLGFFAGFFERLVPDLLQKTNLGTEAKRVAGGGAAAPVTPLPPTPPGPGSAPAPSQPPSARGAPEAEPAPEDAVDSCVSDHGVGDDEATPDEALPAASGGVAPPPQE